MSNLERLVSDNMYKEQSWVEKLLKRMRNEADTQAQSFHTYLVEQLLSVANAVLAAVSNQDKTVQNLSSKVDKTVSMKSKYFYSVCFKMSRLLLVFLKKTKDTSNNSIVESERSQEVGLHKVALDFLIQPAIAVIFRPTQIKVLTVLIVDDTSTTCFGKMLTCTYFSPLRSII